MTEDESCSELLLDNQLCFALYSTSLMMTKTYKPLLKALDLTNPSIWPCWCSGKKMA